MRGRPKGSKNGTHNYIKVECIVCGKIKEVYPWEIKCNRKFCSKFCADISKKGRPNTSKTKFVKGQKAWNKGKPFSAEIRAKMKANKKNFLIGEKNPMWKGDDVGYDAVHDWIRRQKGNPKKCEHCGTTTAKKMEWANKDHSYKRILEDYIALCTRCHRKYDYKFNRTCDNPKSELPSNLG